MKLKHQQQSMREQMNQYSDRAARRRRLTKGNTASIFVIILLYFPSLK
jgi:hypothetical protein